MKHLQKGSYACYVILFFFFYYCMAAFSSVLSVYLTGIGIGVADMSLVVSASSLFGFAMIPAAGFFSDRTGKPRHIAGILMIVFGLAAVLFSFSRRVGMLFVLNGLTMSCINAVMPILERMAGAAKYRYGVLRVWGTIGYAAGAQSAGLILQYAPSGVLFGSVLAAGILAAWGIFNAEDPLPQKEENPDRKQVKAGGLSSLFRNPQYLLYLLIALLFFGCSGTNMTYIPILLTDLGVSTGAVGTILLFSTLIEIPVILYSNTFMDRFSGRVLLWMACALTFVEFVTFGFSGSAPLVVTVIILLKAIATTMFMMISLKVVRSLVPENLTTTGLSVVNTFNSVGMILIQNVGGRIVARTSLPFFYRVMAGILLLIMLLAFFLRSGREKPVFD